MDASRNDSHIPFLDHIRGFAILIVFLFHCMVETHGFDAIKWAGWFRDFGGIENSFMVLLPTTFGWAGVSIFFVVSGFCIHLSHMRSSQKDVSTFFIRRFFRIFPPYAVALVIFSFLFPWHAVSIRSWSGIIQFFSHFFLVHNLDNRSFFAINASFWSIAVEFQLYLLYPLLILLVNRFSWIRTLWMVAILEVAMRVFVGGYDTVYHTLPPRWIDGSPLYYWFSWSLGAAAADAFLNRRALPFHRVPVWVFPLLMVVTAFVRPLVPFSFLFAALSTVSVVSLLLKKRQEVQEKTTAIGRFASEHLRQVGIVSYSVYLLHQPIIVLVPRIVAKLKPGMTLDPLWMFALCAATWIPVLLLSRLFYRFLELPSIDLGKTIVRRKSKSVRLPHVNPALGRPDAKPSDP